MTENAEDKIRSKRRAAFAVKDPCAAIGKGWYHDPGFCRDFFDRCEEAAFLASPQSLELAFRAGEVADMNGDPHLRNRSVGLLSNAHLVRKDLFWAGKVLDQNRDAAIACCPLCRSDHLRRLGDVLLESRQPAASLKTLSASLEEGGKLLDDDALGRTCFIRSIAHHHDGSRDRALADAGRTLRELPLDSPRGYFVDTPAFIAFFVRAGDPRHDETGLELLEEFRQRTRDLRGWKDMRTRSSWVAGHLRARLGDFRNAQRHLRTAYGHLLKDGFEREVAAVTVDLVQLKCRHASPREDYVRSTRKIIDRTLRMRPDLSEDHRDGLTSMSAVLQDWPGDAFEQLRAFRKSIVSPVPGCLGERLGASG
jgi:hypothetical protein